MLSAADQRKKQIKVAVGGVAGFIGLLVFGMWVSDPNKGQPTALEVAQAKAKEVTKNFTAQSSAVVSPEDAWISNGEKQIASLKEENAELKKKLDDVLQAVNALSKNPKAQVSVNPMVEASPALGPQNGSPAISMPPPRGVSMDQLNEAIVPPPPAPVTTAIMPPPPAPAPGGVGAPQAKGKDGQMDDMIEVISLSEPTSKEKAVKPKKAHSYLPTGSFTTAVLLSGVDAPTGGQAKSNPVPVLLRLMDDGQLPNFFNSDVDDCHVLGAAYGDISSERAHVRLETLTCVLVNGDIIEEPIAGYVAGEDGKAGLRGRLVEKQGAMIARSLLAGVASGMASGVTQQYQQVSTSALGSVSTVDPNRIVQNGLAQGTSNALEKIADYYIERANEMYPIIEVDANRIGEVILTGGTDLKHNIIGNKRERK